LLAVLGPLDLIRSFLFARFWALWLANRCLNALFATEWAEDGFIGPRRFIANLQADARLIAVGELDAGRLKGGADGGEVVCPWRPLSFLEIDDDTARDTGRGGKGILIHFDESASCAALRARERQIVQHSTRC
jgi:hypothetical protein